MIILIKPVHKISCTDVTTSADIKKMMILSGFDKSAHYEDVGIQSDGAPVIFDKGGHFNCLSTQYKLLIKRV